MKTQILRQFEYNDWANSKIIDYIAGLEKIPDKVLKIMCHLILAQDVWLDRIIGKSDFLLPIWEEYSIQECKVMSENSSENWLKYLRKKSEDSLQKFVEYKNSKGDEFENRLIDIVTHVITHSFYHRGQINQLFRQNDIEPLQLDFILYVRKDQ